jgi:hypothetical protein
MERLTRNTISPINNFTSYFFSSFLLFFPYEKILIHFQNTSHK